MPPRGRASDVNATAAALLACCTTGPMTGGQLVAAAAERFGAFFSVTRSQVYRELPALTEAGLLKLGDQGPRASQQYVLTAAGKRAFRAWLTQRRRLGRAAQPAGAAAAARRLAHRPAAGRARPAGREAFSTRLASARAAARGEADPFRRAVADFAVAHNRAMVKLLDAIPAGLGTSGSGRHRPAAYLGSVVHPDVAAELKDLSATLDSIEAVTDLPALRTEIDELSEQAGRPDLWNDPEAAQKVTSRLSHAQGDLRRVEELRRRLDDLPVLYELAEEEGDAEDRSPTRRPSG